MRDLFDDDDDDDDDDNDDPKERSNPYTPATVPKRKKEKTRTKVEIPELSKNKQRILGGDIKVFYSEIPANSDTNAEVTQN